MSQLSRVTEITEDIHQLVRDLAATMYSHEAVGIAAIQIGRLERIFLIDGQVLDGGVDAPIVFINPEVIEISPDFSVFKEGCLSFPGIFVDIKRPRWAKVRAMDLDGNTFEIDGEGVFGRAMQHEYDHLTGKLMIDMVGMVKKKQIKQKMKCWRSTPE